MCRLLPHRGARGLLRGDGTAATAPSCPSSACHATARRPEELHTRGHCCAATAPPPLRRAASAAPAMPPVRRPEALHARGDCCAATAPPPPRSAVSAAPATPRRAALKSCTRAVTAARHRRHRAALPQQRLPRHGTPPRGAARARPLLRGDGTAATAPRCLSSACHATCVPPRGATRARRLLPEPSSIAFVAHYACMRRTACVVRAILRHLALHLLLSRVSEQGM